MQLAAKVTFLRRFAAFFYGIGVIVCLCGALRFESNIEDVFQWLPDHTRDREVYNQFVSSFGVDDFLVVTWPERSVQDRRLDTFTEALTLHDEYRLIERVVSGRDLIRQLAGKNGQSPREIIR